MFYGVVKLLHSPFATHRVRLAFVLQPENSTCVCTKLLGNVAAKYTYHYNIAAPISSTRFSWWFVSKLRQAEQVATQNIEGEHGRALFDDDAVAHKVAAKIVSSAFVAQTNENGSDGLAAG